MRVHTQVMRSIASLGAAVALAGAGLAALAPVAPAAAAGSSNGVLAAGTSTPVVLGPAPATPTFVPGTTAPPASGQLRAQSVTATFTVIYDAGFNANPSAKAAFQAAVDQWSNVISSPVPIVVNASFTALGAGILGSAGADAFARNFSGAPQTNTWYPVALANARHGSDLDPANPDIDAQFSSSFGSFYFGTDGNPGGLVDFESVVLHELGHGLGFLGVMDVSSGLGYCCPSGSPVVFDRFTTSNGTPLLSIPNGSAALAAALQGQDVRFNGPKTKAVNGGKTAKLFAPASWQAGSSYSHLDEATYPAGNPNSLMTPAIGSGEAIHSPGPLTLGIFADSGWVVTGLPTVSIAPTRAVEGNSGTRSIRFNLSLSQPAPWAITVPYSTADDTAIAGSDYNAKTGTVTFGAGVNRATAMVSLRGDTTTEATERFKANLGIPKGALLGTSSTVGTILDDEPSSGVLLSVTNASIVEGKQGGRSISVTVTLSQPSVSAVSASWATGTGTATAGVDYTATSGIVNFAAGSTSVQFSVPILPDTAVEANETVPVTLTSPSGATLYRGSGVITIVNDD